MEPLAETEDEFEALYGDGSAAQNAQDVPEPVKDIKQNDVPAPEVSGVEKEAPQSEALPGLGHMTITNDSKGSEATENSKVTQDSEAVHTSGTGSAQPTSEMPENGGDPEWEADSSPYESSSDDSSDSSSDSDSEDEEYELLDPAEQARRLMADDAGSDDDGGGKGAKTGILRTHNEQVEEQVDKPDIEVTPDMTIQELGNVETIVENIAVIKAKTSGEYQVLEAQSLLCLEDRKVIGLVSETLGRVQQPLYCVRFTNRQVMEADGVNIGTTVFYVPGHSTFVFTKALQSVKGSDASNIYDEEVGADEIEFSDDEAEADYKRMMKQQKQAKRAGRGNGKADMQSNLRQPPKMNYDDDAHEDELYTPLARPANLHQMAGPETMERPGRPYDRPHRGGRGRGDRSRGRGRGGRGGFGAGNQRQHHLPEKPSMPQQGPYNPHQTSMPQPAFAGGQAAPVQFDQNQTSYGYPQGFQPQLTNVGQGQSMPFWPQGYQQFYQQPPQHHSQPAAQMQGYQQPQSQGTHPMPMPQFPPGAAINPLFYQNPQQRQDPPQ